MKQILKYFNNILAGGPLLPAEELDMEANWRDMSSPNRRECIKNYGFCIPSKEMIETLAFLSPFLEIGAGTGFLSRLLSDRGADIIATNYRGKEYGQTVGAYFPVKNFGAKAAVEHYSERNILCSWPCYSKPWAYNALKAMSLDKTFAYIGETGWGCTADYKFEKFMARCSYERIHIPSWPTIHDDLFLIRKNGANNEHTTHS